MKLKWPKTRLGLQAIKDGMPDIVLMDIGLPVMNGWEATTAAKNTKNFAYPHHCFTAHALEEDRVKALKAGADDFDTKPVDLKGCRKIEALLPD